MRRQHLHPNNLVVLFFASFTPERLISPLLQPQGIPVLMKDSEHSWHPIVALEKTPEGPLDNKKDQTSQS